MLAKYFFLFTISMILFKRLSNKALYLHFWLKMKTFESFCDSVKTRIWLHIVEAVLCYPRNFYICWQTEKTRLLVHCLTPFTLFMNEMWKIIPCISKVSLFLRVWILRLILRIWKIILMLPMSSLSVWLDL